MREPHSNESLALQALALHYAAGAMPAEDAGAFEAQLSTDQAARDALAEAIRLSAAALGHIEPRPDRTLRSRIGERLFRRGHWLARRTYRGHPAAWAGLGAAVVAATTLAALQFAEDPLAPDFSSPHGAPSQPVAQPRPVPVPQPLAPRTGDASLLAMEANAAEPPAAPTTELTAKMGPANPAEKAVEDDAKWKR